MKVDFSPVITNLRGDAMHRDDRGMITLSLVEAVAPDMTVGQFRRMLSTQFAAKAESLTLGVVAADALCTQVQGDTVSTKDKLLRFELAQIVVKGGVTELKNSDVDLIKDVIGKYCTIVVCGAAHKLLIEATESSPAE